jgi:C1A family cysteine protease
VAALESSLMPTDPAPDFSEDNLVARSGYGPFPEGANRYTYGGYDFMAVAYFARWAGPIAETDDPYTYPARSGHVSGPVLKHVQGVVMIPGRAHPLDNDLIKQLVRQYGGVSVGMYWDPGAYEGPWKADDPPAPATYFFGLKNWGENHGVVVVGWDDDYPADRFQGVYGEPEGPGAFLVRNSYGSGFGEGGYFWVSYYDRAFAREQHLGGYGGGVAYSVVEDARNYRKVYQYDKLGVTDRWGYGISRVWGANRFTAAKTQKIAAAGFYTLASGTRYQVWAGSSFRKLRLRASGTAALPGYTTVPFSAKLKVKARKRFIVAVKLVSPGLTHPMAIEWPAKSWMAGATAKAGQSYLSRNGIKAFAQ